jgi:hypothetical protein
MRAHVYRNNFFDDTCALARHETHRDFHPNALFDSSFQAHLTGTPPTSFLPNVSRSGFVPDSSGQVSDASVSPRT